MDLIDGSDNEDMANSYNETNTDSLAKVSKLHG